MEATHSDPDKLFTAAEAAELLQTLPGRLTRLAKRRLMPCVVLPSGEIRFTRQDIASFIEQHRQDAEAKQ